MTPKTAPRTTTRYYSGLDLGQAQEFTAFAVVEKTTEQDHAERVIHSRYGVRHLERFAVGTPYSEIFARLKELLDVPHLKRSALVVDQTGVGKAVTDLLRSTNVVEDIRRLTMSSGLAPTTDGRGGWLVPKKDLVGALQVLLQSRRLQVAESLPEAGLLVKELQNFKMKPTLANGANDPLLAWREGQHDDLVFAVAIAVWQGERDVDWSRLNRPQVIGPMGLSGYGRW